MKKYLALTVVTIMFAVVTVGFADGGPPVPPCGESQQPLPGIKGPGGPPGFFPMLPDFAGHLKLSKDQIRKMDEFRRQMDRETRDLHYKLAHKRLEMRELFGNPSVSEAALLEKQKELSVLEDKLHSKQAVAMIKMRSILTAEQIGELDHMPPPHPPGAMGGMRERPRPE